MHDQRETPTAHQDDLPRAQADLSPTAAPPDPAADTPSGTPRPAALKAAGLLAGLGGVLVLMLALFVLPALKSGPSDLPLGMVTSGLTPETLAAEIEAAHPGAFEIVPLSDADALDAALRNREVVGGIVLSGNDVQARVASAASPTLSGTVTATATQLAAARGSLPVLVDVVPLPESDPSGVGIGGLAFPLVFWGIVPVVAFAAAFPHSHLWRLGGNVAFSLAGGTIVAAVLQFWFGSIVGSFWPVAGAMALGIGALALPLSGLQQALGGRGFTVGAMVMMFLGNPLAGMATTGAWLPAGLGTVGQVLPPGSAGSLVRSVAYFDGVGAAIPLLILLTWVLLGLALNVHAALREQPSNAPEVDSVTAGR